MIISFWVLYSKLELSIKKKKLFNFFVLPLHTFHIRFPLKIKVKNTKSKYF